MKQIALYLGIATLAVQAAEKAVEAEGGTFAIEREPSAIVVKDSAGQSILRYQLEPPAASKLSVESGCYFHPVTTPNGTVLTEVAPSDHLHHRGVFLGWVEMHGKKDADFWGWGEHAPKKNRKIVNCEVAELISSTGQTGFRARNEWLAEGEPLLIEELRALVKAAPSAHVIDLTYTLTPDADLTLSRWAFSGFCVRARKDAQLEAENPDGRVQLPNPSHTKPESDWPAADWYDYTLRLTNGIVAGVAVIDHPKNPPSLWHNHRDIRMLNPCIVAPGPVVLKAKAPLILRYRLVAHDGPTPRQLLNQLRKQWAKE